MDTKGIGHSSASQQKDQRSLQGRPLLAALCIGLLTLVGAYLVHQVETKIDAHNEQMHAETRAKDAAAFVSSSMVVRLNLTSSLSAFVTTQQEAFSAQEFDRFASLLKEDLPGIMSLQLAPNGIVTYLTDIEKNRKALGHDLLADPNRRVLAEKSIRERSYIIAGPINLIQGGRAIIARRPMFFPTQDGNAEAFWGFATVLIDIDALLRDALLRDLNKDFEVAIRGRDGLGAKGEVFVGQQSTFDSALAISDIFLPNASWQIAVAEKNPPISSGFIRSVWYWVVTLIATVLSSIVAYSIVDRPRQLEQQVRQATDRLTAEVQHRIEAEQQARHMAQHDALTCLPNRRLFDELSKLSLATAKREGVQQAVLFIDIDGFKGINDSLGHAAGDEVLRMIAERLIERVRESDIVARVGGDEFVVLLAEKCDVAGAKHVASEILDTISQPFNVGGNIARVGASIGVAIYPDHGLCIETLLQKSDTAMYAAKEAGKNCYKLAALEACSAIII